jgi:hypothetical protein
MRILVAAVLWSAAFTCGAQALDIQRALILRDQQSAEFAAQVRGSPDLGRLQQLHAAQLREASLPLYPETLMPYQRERMAQDREFLLPAPVVRAKPAEKALPLPGGPKHGVDPIPVQGTGP